MDDAPMTDEEFYARLARINLPPDLREEAGRRQLRAAEATMRRRVFWYSGPTRSDYVVNSTPWRAQSAGAAALAQAVMNPGTWLRLPGARSVRAWHASVSRAVEQIGGEIDMGLAAALAPRRERGPGTHFRTREGRVWMQWQPGDLVVGRAP